MLAIGNLTHLDALDFQQRETFILSKVLSFRLAPKVGNQLTSACGYRYFAF